MKDEENLVVKLLDKANRSVNRVISDILSHDTIDDVEEPPQVEHMKETSQWNEKLFTKRNDLNPRYVDNYHKFADKYEIFNCVVLHYKSDSRLFLCREETLEDLKQFQVCHLTFNQGSLI